MSDAERNAELHKYWREAAEFSVRTHNCIVNARIASIGKLTTWSERDLLSMPNFGRKSLNEVVMFLSLRGLSLRQIKRPVSPWETWAANKLRSEGWTVTPPA